MTNLTVVSPVPGLTLPADTDLLKTLLLALEVKSEATIKAYRKDWKHFSTWCDLNGFKPMPAAPDTLVAYIEALTGIYAVATIQRRLATISELHQLWGVESPATHKRVRLAVQKLRKTQGVTQKVASPLLTDDVRDMVRTLPENRKGWRDRAVLLVGFAGAFRRSELAALNFEDVQFVNDGVRITIRRSKTNQVGEPEAIGIPKGTRPATCPVLALQNWINHGRITEGPLFRQIRKGDHVTAARLSDRAVAVIVQETAQAAGLEIDNVSGHSLRCGFATQAAMNGASDRAIMKQTRHKTRAMVDRYVRDGSLFRDNGASVLGL